MPCGIINAMEVSIDKSGRVVVPKMLRERLGLFPGRKLQAQEVSGGLLIQPAEQKPSMIQVDGLWVHQGKPQPDANWDSLVNDVREERLNDILKP